MSIRPTTPLSYALLASSVIAMSTASLACTPSTPTWDRHSTLTCAVGAVSLQGEHLKFDHTPVIQATGSCVVTLVDCDIEAPHNAGESVVSIGKGATLVVRGGHYDGDFGVSDKGSKATFSNVTVKGRVAVQGGATFEDDGSILGGLDEYGAGSEAKVARSHVARIFMLSGTHLTADGATFEGQITLHDAWLTAHDVVVQGDAQSISFAGTNRIEGAPALEAIVRDRALTEKWAPKACDDVEPCYVAADVVGNIDGRVRVRVHNDGRVVSVTYKSSSAPAKVRACIEQRSRERQIDAFEGPDRELGCTYAGPFTGEGTFRGRSVQGRLRVPEVAPVLVGGVTTTTSFDVVQ